MVCIFTENRMHRLVLLILSFIIPLLIKAQSLNLVASNDSIRHVLSLKMEPEIVEKIHKIRGEKFDFTVSGILHNGKELQVDEIELHGKTSLDLPRKSFSVSLEERLIFDYENNTKKLLDLFLICLSMDKNHFRNRLSYLLLSEMGIFNLSSGYANVLLNDRNEGIYLFIQRPQDWAIKEIGSPYILRRDYDNQIDNEKFSGSLNTEDQKRCRERYYQIYQIAERKKGCRFYRKSMKKIDLEEYFTWLAFNYWFMNGDYTDEVYFYIDPKTELFRPIPWDYDDIFSETPHEGDVERLRPPHDDFFFSIEELLDQKLIVDDYTYTQYKAVLYNLLQKITPDDLKKHLENIYAELYPYYLIDEIIIQTEYDKYGKTDLDGLRKEMNEKYAFLVKRREEILKRLEKQ